MSEYRVKFHREGAMAGPVDLGPYPDKARADKSAEFYREMGNSNVRVVPVSESRRARAHERIGRGRVVGRDCVELDGHQCRGDILLRR